VSTPEAGPPESLSGAFAEAAARSARLEAQLRRDPGAHRVLTGDRPTGPLHLGHYFGTLQNRVRLQDLGVDLMVLVADYQTIIDRDSATSLPDDVEALVADYLAVGIDPGRATIFAHSQVEALNQLLLPFLSLVSVAELSRNPTVKDEMDVDVGPDVHVSHPSGRRHPVLQGHGRSGGQGPASPSGADAPHRAALQPPLQP
jgi:tryptophanyl-tRNA synthetase